MLLLGGTGFIGAHLASRLVAEGRAVVAVDVERHFGAAGPDEVAVVGEWRRRALLDDVEVVHADVLDVARLRALVDEWSPAAVVHLANLPLAWVAASEPALAERAILGATGSVLHALDERPVRLVYVSSSMVYGTFDREPMPEEAPLRPANAYGRLKLAAERAVRASRPNAVVVRPSAVYGPGDADGRILQRLVDAAQGAGTVEVDDPETALDFTWVGDLAAGLAAAASVPGAAGETFNLTRGVARTLAEAAAIAGVALRVRRPAEPHVRRGALDVTRARNVLGYRPTVDLEDGLPALADWAAAPA